MNATNEHQVSSLEPSSERQILLHANGNCGPFALFLSYFSFVGARPHTSDSNQMAAQLHCNPVMYGPRYIAQTMFSLKLMLASTTRRATARPIFILINKILFIESTSNHGSSFLSLVPSSLLRTADRN